MMVTVEKPNCVTCLWRELHNDGAHVTCRHPATEHILKTLVPTVVACVIPKDLNLDYDQHGYEMGEFDFPWKFLPEHLVKCGGYKTVHTVDGRHQP